jgi:hypothetical protein
VPSIIKGVFFHQKSKNTMKEHLYLIGITAAGVYVGLLAFEVTKHFVLHHPSVMPPKPLEVVPAK